MDEKPPLAGLRAVCFVDMPFGTKPDLVSGVEVDFDGIYAAAIEPAIREAGLEPVRGDRERTGGIIHAPMFGRLLLSDFVVADLTLNNPNVFYELGIRHTARPFTTVPIFSPINSLPFDVSLVRAIPYTLEKGKLTAENAATLKANLLNRLREAIQGAASQDSPLFQLIPKFPKVDLPHDVTEIFQDQVRHSDDFRKQLMAARAESSDALRLQALKQIEQSLCDVKVAQNEVLVDLMLSYRDVGAWDDMVRLSDDFPDYLKSNTLVSQQRALALNRRGKAGDSEGAERILQSILAAKGADPETLGLLGRVYKDRYKKLKEKKSIMAAAAIDAAIEAYTRGFNADPRDYYPGVNAVTLLVEKGDPDSLAEAERLSPLVSFAVARRGGVSSTDYWDLATLLELSAVGNDWKMALRVLPKVLMASSESWKIKTTWDTLVMLQSARKRAGQATVEIDAMVAEFAARYEEICGEVKPPAAGTA